jgi:septal ring factor EnvC (AmiA/AmiB activator)
MRRAVALGLLLTLAAPALAQEEDLEALRRAITERRERVARFEREESGLFEAIEAADVAARQLAGALVRAETEAGGAEREALAREGELAKVKARLARTREVIGRRAVALYKAGELGPVAVVFSAGSLRDRIARIQALQLLLDHDQRLLARFTQERNELARARVAADRAGVERNEAQAALLAGRLRAPSRSRASRGASPRPCPAACCATSAACSTPSTAPRPSARASTSRSTAESPSTRWRPARCASPAGSPATGAW